MTSIVIATMLCSFAVTEQTSTVRTAHMYAPHLTWELTNESFQGNPFDVVASVIFTHEDGKTIHKTEMFYTGGTTWAFRFTGTKTGRWAFRSTSDDPELDDHTGTIDVRPNPDTTASGFLTHVDNQFAVPMGDDGELNGYSFTVFMDGTQFMPRDFHRWSKKDITTYCQLAKSNGCEIIFVHINNQWFKQGTLAWNEHDSTDPDLATFACLDKIIISVFESGCRVHFWAWGDESRKWTPIGVPGGINGPADRRLQRYIAARLGPLPGWTMGYGFDLHEWTSEKELNSWSAYLHKHLGWQHLLAARGVPLRGRDNIRSYDGFGLSVAVTTTSHGPRDYQEIVKDLQGDATQPHLYEERHSYRRKGFVLDMNGTRRLLWWETMAGGMGGFFGFYQKSSSAFAGHPYPQPEQLQTHFRFWHEHHRFRLGMQPSDKLSQEVWALRDRSSMFYVFYAEDTDKVSMNLAGATKDRQAVAVDTRKPYQELSLGRLTPKMHRWQAPYKTDWAIAVGD